MLRYAAEAWRCWYTGTVWSVRVPRRFSTIVSVGSYIVVQEFVKFDRFFGMTLNAALPNIAYEKAVGDGKEKETSPLNKQPHTSQPA